MTISLALGLLFTYLAAPAALYVALLQFCGYHGHDWRLLGICFGITPPLISRCVVWLLYAYPGGADFTYIAAVVALFILFAVYGRNRIAAFNQMKAALTSWWRGALEAGAVALVVATSAIAMIFASAGEQLWAQSYSHLVGSWDPNANGWAGTMPPFATATLMALALAAGWKLLAPDSSSASTLRSNVTLGVLAGLVLTVIVVIAVLQFGRPVYESDALNYFKLATLLYEEKSLTSYPVVAPQPDGMYDPSAHPLGHIGTLIWNFMLAGSPAPGAGKLGVLMATVATLVGLWVALHPRGPVAVLAAMLILVTTPAYVAQVVGLGMDAQRLSLLLLTLIALVLAAQRPGWRTWVVGGVVAGLALNSHSQMAVLVPTVVVVTIVLSWSTPARERLLGMLIVGIVAFLVGGERYVLNLVQFGTPVYNGAAIFELVPGLDYHGWRFGLAPRQDLWGRLSSGGLMGFTYWYFFGLSWWLGLLAIVVEAKEVLACAMLRAVSATVLVSLAFLVAFFAFTSAGELLIANYRYALSLQPMVAVLGGVFIGHLYELRAARA